MNIMHKTHYSTKIDARIFRHSHTHTYSMALYWRPVAGDIYCWSGLHIDTSWCKNGVVMSHWQPVMFKWRHLLFKWRHFCDVMQQNTKCHDDSAVMSSVLTSRLHKIIVLFLLDYRWIWMTHYYVLLKTSCDVIQPNTNCYDDSAMMSSVLTSRFHHLLLSYYIVWCHLIITKPTQYYCIVFMTSYKVSLLFCYYDFTGAVGMSQENCIVLWRHMRSCVYFIIDVIVMMQHFCFSNHYVTIVM